MVAGTIWLSNTFFYTLFFYFISTINSAPCICENDRTVLCTFEINDGILRSDNCLCGAGFEKVFETSGLNVIVQCKQINEEEKQSEAKLKQAGLMRCYANSMDKTWEDITKYLLIAGGAWIVLWCIASILINIMHKNKGHHRYLQFFQELFIIILIIAICGVNRFFPEKQLICKIITIVSHFFMVSAATAFFLEAIFAHSMIQGSSKKNGKLPVFFNYIIPLILPALPAGLTYYFEKDNYGSSLIHCFVSLTQHMMWGFVIPTWILISAAIVKAQLGCLSCDKTNKDQNEAQCFWAKRSSKSLSIVAGGLFSIWLLTMHAIDQYVIYLFIIDFVLCFLYGPILFICHTFCHENTCKKWEKPGCFGRMYYICPIQKSEVIIKTEIVYTSNPDNVPELKQTTNQAGRPSRGYQSSPMINDSQHTTAQSFYSWLMDPYSNENILFNRSR